MTEADRAVAKVLTDLAEELRKRHGKVAIVGEAAGWHVQYLHHQQTDSVGASVRSEWRPATGITVGLPEALVEATRPVPTVAVAPQAGQEPAQTTDAPVEQPAETKVAYAGGPALREPKCPACGGKIVAASRWGQRMALCANKVCSEYSHPIGYAGEFDWGAAQ